jgi:hypothetical protein
VDVPSIAPLLPTVHEVAGVGRCAAVERPPRQRAVSETVREDRPCSPSSFITIGR